MTDQMPCPSCGLSYCYSLTPGANCCSSCTGNHDSDTYARFYPEPTTKEN